jgi:hypothetical protein
MRGTFIFGFALASGGCTLGLTGFLCTTDQSCGGGGRMCIAQGCAAPDPSCGANGYRWDNTAGSRANTCAVVADLAVPPGADLAGGDFAIGSGNCTILAAGYPAGTINPANSCQVCNPGVSMTMWSSIADGTSCTNGKCAAGMCCTGCVDGGGFCHSGSSTHHCGVMGAACISCDDGNPCHANLCRVNGTCDNSAVANGTACAGTMCATGAACPGACAGDGGTAGAQCAQQGTCTAGTCGGTFTLVCCPTSFQCNLFGGRSYCEGP